MRNCAGLQLRSSNDLPQRQDQTLGEKWRRGGAIALLTSLSLCTVTPPALSVSPHPQTTVPREFQPHQLASNSIPALEAKVLKGVNRIRKKHGLVPLRYNATLVGVARRHSHNMLSNWFFAHKDQYGHTVLERVQRTGLPLRLAAENLAWTSNAKNPVKLAIRSWVKSPGHLQNILEPRLRETGVGIARRGGEYFFTQVFMLQ